MSTKLLMAVTTPQANRFIGLIRSNPNFADSITLQVVRSLTPGRIDVEASVNTPQLPDLEFAALFYVNGIIMGQLDTR